MARGGKYSGAGKIVGDLGELREGPAGAKKYEEGLRVCVCRQVKQRQGDWCDPREA